MFEPRSKSGDSTPKVIYVQETLDEYMPKDDKSSERDRDAGIRAMDKEWRDFTAYRRRR